MTHLAVLPYLTVDSSRHYQTRDAAAGPVQRPRFSSSDCTIGDNQLLISRARDKQEPVQLLAAVGELAPVAYTPLAQPAPVIQLFPTARTQPAQSGPRRSVRRRVHASDGCDALRWIAADAPVPESVRGLCYRTGQTFGIEFELAPKRGEIPSEDSAEWLRIANAIAAALKQRLPTGSFGGVYAEYIGCERAAKSPEHWNVEYDDSVGWEVTTRVLRGVEGFREVAVACRALQQVAQEHDLCVDVRTGTHIHLGWQGSIDELKQAMALVKLFEPAIGSLVAPSRIARLADGHYDVSQPNMYCRPLSSVLDAQTALDVRSYADLARITSGDDELRYVTFNLRPLHHQQTVEVRLHHGTLDAHAILLWVSLWQQILWAAEHPRRRLERVADVQVITPSSDLLALAREYLPSIEQPGQREFLAQLRRQRAQIVEREWTRAPELASWVQASQAWT